MILSALLNVALDVSEGLCNSFDTTIAIEDFVNYGDTDTDSGVHNNSTPDNLDHLETLDTLESRTNDSLYESLKYQQGELVWSVARGQTEHYSILHTRRLNV